MRAAIVAHREALASWREEAAFATPPPPRPPPPQTLAVPPGLPGELADYLRGAIAYQVDDPGKARAAWEALLARPAAERPRRTTWAAFMLGKTLVKDDPAEAVRWFERTREFASQGFADPLGLAEASLGWQARAEMNRGRFDEALKLYLQQEKAGDPTALPSIRRVCARVLADPKLLQQVARSPEARPMFTAWVLSDWTRKDYDGPLDTAAARKWLAAVQAAGITTADGADRLAWAAYRAGDFAAAEPGCGGRRPTRRWRAGSAPSSCCAPARSPRPRRSWRRPSPRSPRRPRRTPISGRLTTPRSSPPNRPRAAGELGAVRLARGEYTAALDDLCGGGWWTDAAYVAERVLTLDELRAYVDKTWPAALAARHKPGDEPKNVDEPGNAWEVQYAGLAPPRTRRRPTTCAISSAAASRGPAASPTPRPISPRASGGLWTISRARWHDGPNRPRSARRRSSAPPAWSAIRGWSWSAPSSSPDWFVHEGEYDQPSFAEARANPKTHRHLGPAPDERQRAARGRAEPEKRFHYRYQGMDLAQEAAKLLPAGTEERAGRLATAGNWVEGIDPKGARPLYDAIQSCCGDTEIARRSRKVNAITNIEDACPADVKPKPDAQQ